jgi:hypothetical protein
MRKLLTQLSLAIPLLIVMLACLGVNAQRRYSPLTVSDLLYTIQNEVQTAPNTFTFDLYLQHTDPSTIMEMATIQAGINVSPTIYNGGTMTCTIISGFSDLPTAMQPTSVQFTNSVNLIKLAGKTPPGAGNGPTILTTAPGTRICRLQVTTSTTFTVNSQAGMTFTSSSAVVPSYATRVAIYIAGINTQLTITPGTNAINQGGDPYLNPTPPLYTVGGTGSYCQDGGGLTVTLSNSTTGVNYQLYKNNVASGSTVPGSTGNALSWTGELAGTYTITGTNTNGTATMTGNAVLTENPKPAAAGSITGTSPVIQGNNGIAYSVGAIANATSYTWNYSGTGATIHNNGAAAITVDFSSTATSGTLSVYGLNTCGQGTSSTYPVTVNAGLNSWTGTISTDWFTPGNWSNNIVPTLNDDISISSAATYQPTIAGATVAVCKNAEVQIGAKITVTGSFTASSLLTLDGGENLVIDNGSFIDAGIAGAGTSKYLKTMTNTAPGRWHYVSSPISNGEAGIFLTDFLVWYNTPTNSWASYILNQYTPLTVMQGYAAYVPSTNPATKIFAGALNTGAQSIPCGIQTIPSTGVGYNLVGNCFPSAIDLASVTTWPSASHTCWFWDPENLTYTLYLTHAPYPSHSQYAPAVQAFFVEAAAAGNFGLNNGNRVHNSEAFVKDGAVYTNALSIKATSQVNSYVDEAVVGFDPATTTGYDVNYDAIKLAGGTDAPQIYSVLPTGEKVAYNVQPAVDVNTVIPMGFTCGINGNMTLNASHLETFDASVSIYLEDLKEGTIQNLKVNPAYSFTYNTGDNANRFVLHFSNITGINEHSSGIQVYSFENSVYIKNLNAQKLQNVFVYDLLGKEVFQSALNQNPLQKYTLNVNQGYYLVKIVSENGVTTQKVYIN